MLREFDIEHLVVTIILFSLVILMALLSFLEGTTPEGYITAQGGNVTVMNVQTLLSVPWGILCGNLTLTGSNSTLLFSDDVLGENIYAENNSLTMVLITSPKQNVNISNLQPANLSEIDAFLGIDSSHYASASKTFKNYTNLTFAGFFYSVWAARTNSPTDNYYTYAFKDGADLVFITKSQQQGNAFDNTRADYQMILPVNSSVIYYHETINDIPITEMDFNPVVIKVNGSNLTFDWDIIPGATQYNLIYIDDISDPAPNSDFSLNFSNPTVISDISKPYIDVNPPNNRYYKIEAENGGSKTTSSEIISYMNIPLYYRNGIGHNLISFPMELSTTDLKELLKPIMPDLNYVYWYDNAVKGYFSMSVRKVGSNYVFIGSIPLRKSNAYWLEVSRDTSLPVAGVLYNETEMNLTAGLNLMGYHIIEGDNRVSTVFNPLLPSMDYAYWYDNNNKGFLSGRVQNVGMLYFFVSIMQPIGLADGYFMDMHSDANYRWPE